MLSHRENIHHKAGLIIENRVVNLRGGGCVVLQYAALAYRYLLG